MADEYLSLSGTDVRATRPSFEIGKVIKTTISTYFSNLVPILALSLVAYAPLIVFGTLKGEDIWVVPDPVIFLTFFLLIAIAAQLCTAFITVAVFRFLRGSKVSLRECFSTGFRKAPVAFLAAILVGLATMVGYLLCLIPGFIVQMMYAVAVPVTIVEGKGAIQAMARSKELTKGNRWIIFGTFLLTGLLTNLPAQIGAVLLQENLTAYVAWVLSWTVLGGTFQAVLVCVMYYHLREEHEDLDLADLAAVFD
jgi:hypothetical protein